MDCVGADCVGGNNLEYTNEMTYNNTSWRDASKAYREEKLFCEVWLALGRHEKVIKGGGVTDHIVPHSQGGAFRDKRNWMPMSHFWHNRKRKLEEGKLNIKTTDGKDGLIPEDRNEIINLLIEKYGDDERVTGSFDTNTDGTAYHLYDV